MHSAARIIRGMFFVVSVFAGLAVFPATAPGNDAILFPIVVEKAAVPKTSYLSIPYTAFVGPLDATGALLMTGACWNENNSFLLYLGAPVMLPHGAVIKEVRVDYYQYYAGDEGNLYLFRVSNTSQHTTMATLTCNDSGSGRVTTTDITAPVVDNADYSYLIQAYGFRCDRKMAIRSVRITYEIL